MLNCIIVIDYKDLYLFYRHIRFINLKIIFNKFYLKILIIDFEIKFNLIIGFFLKILKKFINKNLIWIWNLKINPTLKLLKNIIIPVFYSYFIDFFLILFNSIIKITKIYIFV